MTREERDVLLIDCNKKLEEIKHQKQLEEQAFKNHYDKNYRVRFAIEDVLGKASSSSISGMLLVGSACALAAIGYSKAVTFGLPVGVYMTVGLSAIIATLANIKKKSEYWQELGNHTSIQDDYEEESNIYRLVSKYITMGDKYLLQLYRESLKTNTVGTKDEFWYLDFDTTNLSPLMVKALEEIKKRSLELRDKLRSDILESTNSMQLQIAESPTIPILELEEIQKLLKQHIPTLPENQALTK